MLRCSRRSSRRVRGRQRQRPGARTRREPFRCERAERAPRTTGVVRGRRDPVGRQPPRSLPLQRDTDPRPRIETRLSERRAHEHTLRLRLYTPSGFLYQVLAVPVGRERPSTSRGPAAGGGDLDHGERALTAAGRSCRSSTTRASRAVPAVTSSSGPDRGHEPDENQNRSPAWAVLGGEEVCPCS
jgi:hypothetical protein